MRYDLTLADSGDYLIIKVVGDFNRKDAEAITSAAFQVGSELGISCYLTDVTEARNVERAMENVRFTEENRYPAEEGEAGPCTAVLVDPIDHSHDFYVAYARRSGIDITIFRDRNSAIEHLTKTAARLNHDDRNARSSEGSDGPRRPAEGEEPTATTVDQQPSPTS